ncbi:hypothetical protein A2348_05590 [Candidatus Uhrbacteria bacterium RIFOXYB12_FULL_58_10]|uniref:Uncharacterized protein n=1 Tax=Candidatus Uhrbacteria bacterium RIFOXYB2_FULL_57_15 TaxID=1802422 RepID=A0A1F7W9J0_9BACT|nr:MAG: hypothetical protein A2348_05590 [Candidatus Uhrbacteria bacterium RIFOXYB12_FULL_58_10]OGL98867.1 MAG: hypothetical protein A2304_03905 [Candidatus Uhrbacteria bacterium RIFOXYB2_FULL_57_15]
MPRRAEQPFSSHAEAEPPKSRKHVDATKKLLGIREIRGRDAGAERVSVVDNSGNERFVSMSREELNRAEARADRDFERTVAAVTAGANVDSAMATELFGANKENILALARKEGDIKGAMYRVMEDAIDAMSEYDRLVEKAVTDSGYTGIVAEGLRNSLLGERSRVFGDAFSQSAGPRAKRNLENAVRGKVLAEASRQVSALAETVGKPKRADNVSDILSDVQVLKKTEKRMRENPADASLPGRVNAIDRMIQQNVAEWAVQYLTENPKASAAAVLKEAEANGLDEFITRQDVTKLKRGVAVDELHAPVTKEEQMAALEALKPELIVERVRAGAVKEGPGAPLEQAIVDDGITYDRHLDKPGEITERHAAEQRAEAIIARNERRQRKKNPTAMEDYDMPVFTGESKVPDVSDLLEEEVAPANKGFLQGLAKTGRKALLGMALLFGLKAGSPDQRLPHQDDQGPERETASLQEAVDVMAAPTGSVIADTKGMTGERNDSLLAPEAKPSRVDTIFAKGDPRNLERALKNLDEAMNEAGLPSKAEFLRLKAAERKAKITEMRERMEVMKELSRTDSPAISAMKRAELGQKLEDHQRFLDLMKSIR